MDKPRVYTLKSQTLIKKEKFPDITRRLKRYLKDDQESQESTNLVFLIKKFGWKPYSNLKTWDIVSLNYSDTTWNSKAHSLLFVLSKYIEPGGFIHLANEIDQKFWVYRFDGTWFKRNLLTKYLVDLDSKEDIENHYSKIVDEAIKIGTSRDQMVDIIKKKLGQKIVSL